MRLHVHSLWAALEARRSFKGLSWRDVARETGCSASTLTRIKSGRRPDVDTFGSLVFWLELDPKAFFVKRKDVRALDLVADLGAHIDAGRSKKKAGL